MQTPLQITYRGIDHSEAADVRIRARAAKLRTLHRRITACRVVLDQTRSHLHHHKHYHVRVELRLPHAEIVVENDPLASILHDDLHTAIDHAFDLAERRLEEHIARRRAKQRVREPA